MQIIELDKSKYQDYPVNIDYDTDSYYDLIFDDDCIRIQKKAMGHLHHHQGDSDSEKLFQDWVEQARAFGAFEDDKLVGVIEVGIDYSQRLFVNLLKVEKQYRRKGTATALINKAKELMYENNIRSLILEVQSCNVDAIEFYKTQGFKLIGKDLNLSVLIRLVTAIMIFKTKKCGLTWVLSIRTTRNDHYAKVFKIRLYRYLMISGEA